MKNAKGQTTVEMVFILPLLMMLMGGMLFMVYVGWQDLKIQQAANLVARVEGQEKVSGGRSIDAINRENGFGQNGSQLDGDSTIGRADFDISEQTQANSDGSPLSVRMKNLVAGFLGTGDHSNVSLLAPRSGQNVDFITITRTFTVPKIPFFKSNAGLPQTMTLKGTAYGGEDPHMYALPRWGKTSDSGNTPEWRNLLKSAAQKTTD